MLLGLTEVGLRIGGYGYPTSFFARVANTNAYTANPCFGWRFFPRTVSRRAWPFYLPKDKDADTYRIFILGGSAAQGVPEPAFSFGRILQAMLAETYPDTTFEVVNTAMTAINSHVVLPIARDCARFDPDLFIIYLGNNEITGPFGAGTVFDAFTPSLSLIRVSLAIKKTRLGQLTASVSRSLRNRQAPQYWAGMEMYQDNRVPADDPRLTGLFEHFAKNLRDICRAGHDAGANVIVSTVAVNLTDCAPFASDHREDLGERDLASWTDAYQGGIEHEQAGDFEAAIDRYLSAAKIDDRFAKLHFRLGRCYQATGQDAAAGQAFSLARDLDALRFRADTNINRVIREVAGDLQERGVLLADAQRELVGDDPALTDDVLFYEHVHLTFQGNYELAKVIFPLIVQELPLAIRSAGPAEPEPPSMPRCAERLAMTPWQHAQMLLYMSGMIGRPPFTEQLGHSERLASMREALARATSTFGPQTAAETTQRFENALEMAPDDLLLHKNLARFLRVSGRPAEAQEHLQFVIDRVPNDPGGHLELAGVLLALGDTGGATSQLKKSVDVAVDKAQAHTGVSEFYLAQGRIEAATRHCRRSLDLRPNDPKTLAMMGWIHLSAREWPEAIEMFAKSLDLRPGNARNHQDLALALFATGRSQEGTEHLAKAVELAPQMPSPRRYYAGALSRQDQFEQATTQYQELLRLAPDDMAIRGEYGQHFLRMKAYAQAAAEFRAVLARQGNSVSALNNLAWLLATCDDPAVRDVPQAVELAKRAAELTRYEHLTILDTLAVAYAEADQFDQATNTIRKAMALATRTGKSELIAGLREQLALYEAHKRRPREYP